MTHACIGLMKECSYRIFTPHYLARILIFNSCTSCTVSMFKILLNSCTKKLKRNFKDAIAFIFKEVRLIRSYKQHATQNNNYAHFNRIETIYIFYYQRRFGSYIYSLFSQCTQLNDTEYYIYFVFLLKQNNEHCVFHKKNKNNNKNSSIYQAFEMNR